jgi:hypothetical protein
MRTDNKKNNFWIILLVAVLTISLSSQGYCRQQESEGYAMMIQHSPIGGGTITPGDGVHRFGLNEVVTLTAVAKPGYQFVYWLGDVLDETTEQTTAVANSPKIIIAVFERTEYAFLAEFDGITAGMGRGGLISAFRNLGAGDFESWDSREVRDRPTPEPPELYDDDFPVPEDEMGEDFPVPEDEPIPEPATMFLFGVGAVSIAISRRKVRNLPLD